MSILLPFSAAPDGLYCSRYVVSPVPCICTLVYERRTMQCFKAYVLARPKRHPTIYSTSGALPGFGRLKGCASVLNTQSSKLTISGVEKIR
jgi:hypothetical protein